MIIGNRKFENYTYVMAIINLTPDSFFSGSRKTEYTALKAVEEAVANGAAVIDLGAQSTRPGYKEIPPDEEFSRLQNTVQAIKKRFDIPLSVDTYFSSTAKKVLDLGADMINDVSGLGDSGTAEAVAAKGASVCIVHNACVPAENSVFTHILSFLNEKADYALKCGVDKNKIILDGGIGFAKSREQSLELLNGYNRLSALNYPLLLGASRKSLFGGRVEDRLQKTLESTRLAAEQGVLFVRVHDVKENVKVIKEYYERN